MATGPSIRRRARWKTRPLTAVPLDCGGYTSDNLVWVTKWGRAEAPTEPQFRSFERVTGCYYNDILRRTLSATFQAARKDKVPFADLITQQIPLGAGRSKRAVDLTSAPPLKSVGKRLYECEIGLNRVIGELHGRQSR